MMRVHQKSIIVTIALLFATGVTAQVSYPGGYNTRGDTDYTHQQDGIDPGKYGWNKRVAFIVGGGTSVVSTALYEIPVVDKSTNFVTLEKAGSVKSNLSLGIIYTPYIKSVVRSIKVMENEQLVDRTLVEYEPRGISFGLFLNPLSLTGVSANSIANTVDVGFGFGWRSGDFAFLITNEYFLARQPRDYFVDIYRNNDTPYEINGHPQTTIDTTDNNIFKTKVAVSWGVKIAYTFTITKAFIF